MPEANPGELPQERYLSVVASMSKINNLPTAEDESSAEDPGADTPMEAASSPSMHVTSAIAVDPRQASGWGLSSVDVERRGFNGQEGSPLLQSSRCTRVGTVHSAGLAVSPPSDWGC